MRMKVRRIHRARAPYASLVLPRPRRACAKCSTYSDWRAQFAAMKDNGLLELITLEPRRETVIHGLTVTAFPVLHYTPEATALRITVGGKTIAYSGDTGWTDTLLEVAAEADLFICQTYTIDIPQWVYSTTVPCKRVVTS
jgi:hypothetical protein